MPASEHDVRSFIRGFFAAGAVSGVPLAPDLVTDDFDVLVDGRLDSLGFLELLTQLEDRFGRELDLSEVDEEHVTRVGTLVQAVADA